MVNYGVTDKPIILCLASTIISISILVITKEIYREVVCISLNRINTEENPKESMCLFQHVVVSVIVG